MEYATVLKVLKPEFDDWFKQLYLRFQVRCPYCGNRSRHGTVLDPVYHHHGDTIDSAISCNGCFRHYRYTFKI